MIQTSRRDVVWSTARACAAFCLNKPVVYKTAAHTQQSVNPPTPSSWTNVPNGAKVTLFGAEYEAECGPNAIFRNENAIKFILNRGDPGWPEDVSAGSDGHRCELDGYKQTILSGQSFWGAGAFYIDAGPFTTSSWLAIQQHHAAYNFMVNRNSRALYCGLSGGARLGFIPFVYGRRYHFVNNIISGANGMIRTWIDGRLVVNFSGAVVPNRYLKIGIYRDKTATDTMILRYDNLEFGTADLSSRVTSPLPQTSGFLS